MRKLLLLFLLLPLACLAGVPLDIEITGVEGDLKDNVALYLDIVKKKDDEELSARWIKSLHKKAPQQIREGLQPFGYYNPEIESSLNKVEDKWVATYRVTPGDQVRVEKVEIVWEGAGADRPELQREIGS